MDEQKFYTVAALAEIKGCAKDTLWSSLTDPDDAEYWQNTSKPGDNTTPWQIDIGDGNRWQPRPQGYQGHKRKVRDDEDNSML